MSVLFRIECTLIVPEWFHLGFKISWKFLSHGCTCTCLHDKIMVHLKLLCPSVRSPEWWVSWCDYEHLCWHCQLKSLFSKTIAISNHLFLWVGELLPMSFLFLTSSPLCFLHSFMEPTLNILPRNGLQLASPHAFLHSHFCLKQYIWCIIPFLPPRFMNKANCCVSAMWIVVDFNETIHYIVLQVCL